MLGMEGTNTTTTLNQRDNSTFTKGFLFVFVWASFTLWGYISILTLAETPEEWIPGQVWDKPEDDGGGVGCCPFLSMFSSP